MKTKVMTKTRTPKHSLVLCLLILMLATAAQTWALSVDRLSISTPNIHLTPDRNTHLTPVRTVQNTHLTPVQDTHLTPAQDRTVQDTHLIPVRANLPPTAAPASPQSSSNPFRELMASLGSLLKWILILCILAFLLFLLVVALLLWKAKQLVANAVKSDPVALAKLVDKLRHKHPDLDDQALCKKIILRQSNRAGLVGFITGVGGLPTLPLALPIDIAATIRIQANMVHMLRLVRGVEEDEIPEAGLWLATTGGLELATAGSKALRELVVQIISKSLLKFLPLIGGLIGFGLNWASTQTMGRLGLSYMEQSKTTKSTAAATDR